MVDEVPFRAEGEAAHRGVQAVGSHHEVERPARAVPEGGVDAVRVLVEGREVVAEDVLDAVPRLPVQELDEVVAEQFDVVAVQPAAAERHLRGAPRLLAVAVEHRHAPHPGAQGTRLGQDAHPVEDAERDAAHVERLSARAQGGGALDDGGGVAVAAQPVGEGEPGDAGAGDQHGLHMNSFVRCTHVNVRRTRSPGKRVEMPGCGAGGSVVC